MRCSSGRKMHVVADRIVSSTYTRHGLHLGCSRLGRRRIAGTEGGRRKFDARDNCDLHHQDMAGPGCRNAVLGSGSRPTGSRPRGSVTARRLEFGHAACKVSIVEWLQPPCLCKMKTRNACVLDTQVGSEFAVGNKGVRVGQEAGSTTRRNRAFVKCRQVLHTLNDSAYLP